MILLIDSAIVNMSVYNQLLLIAVCISINHLYCSAYRTNHQMPIACITRHSYHTQIFTPAKMSSMNSSDIDLLAHKMTPDSIQGIEMVRDTFARLREKGRDEMAVYMRDRAFYTFLRDAHCVMGSDRVFVDFVCDLRIDEGMAAEYGVVDVVKECMDRKKKVLTDINNVNDKSMNENDESINNDDNVNDGSIGGGINNVNDESIDSVNNENEKGGAGKKADITREMDEECPSKRKRLPRRVSFSLDRNKVRLFLVDKNTMKHGNYKDKDRSEAYVLKHLPWIVPVKINTASPFKTRSREMGIQREREMKSVKITNLESDSFVPNETTIRDEDVSAAAGTAEISIFDVTMRNALPEIDYAKLMEENEDVKRTINDILSDPKIISHFSDKKK